MYVIGITGKIACGKSLVLEKLANLGAETIDADRVYGELVTPGSPLLEQIATAFGNEVMTSAGGLSRAALRQIVQRDPESLLRLDRITHPSVVTEIARRIANSESDVVAVDAVKLFESELAAHCDETWRVVCRESQQIERLMQRNGIDRSAALAWLDAQVCGLDEACEVDFKVDNTASVADTEAQVEARWQTIVSNLGARTRDEQERSVEQTGGS